MSVSWQDNLDRRYRFNGDLTDAEGNSDGAAIGDPQYGDPLFNDGGASLVLDGDDGVSADKIITALTPNLAGVAWAKYTGSPDGSREVVVAQYDIGNDGRCFAFEIDSDACATPGGIAFVYGNFNGSFRGTIGTAGGLITPDEIAQFGFNFDGGTVQIFKDGVEISSSLLSGSSPGVNVQYQDRALTIGHWLDSGTPASMMSGNIDDITLTKTAIDEQFFRDNFVEGRKYHLLRSSESAIWRQLAAAKSATAKTFDWQLAPNGFVLPETIRDTTLAHGEGQGTGIASNGNLNFGGGAIEFNGADDWVDLGLPSQGKQDMAVSFWVKNPVGVSSYLIGDISLGPWNGLALLVSTSGELIVRTAAADSLFTHTFDETLPDDEMAHVIVCYDDSASTMRAYINGEPLADNPVDWSGKPFTASSFNWALGARGDGSSPIFPGSMKPPKMMFGATLTDDEAQAVYAAAARLAIISGGIASLGNGPLVGPTQIGGMQR